MVSGFRHSSGDRKLHERKRAEATLIVIGPRQRASGSSPTSREIETPELMGPCDASLCQQLPGGPTMDTNTLLIIVLIVLLLGGGGFYGRGRWW